MRSITNFSEVEPLKGYNILNAIKPKYFQTTFPYSNFDNNKVIFTQKVVEILVKKGEKLKSPKDKIKDKSLKDKTKKDKTKKDKVKKKKGGSISAIQSIIIYG